MNKSELFLSWHMLVKGDAELAIKSLDSLQGLYDECIIAVDDGQDSDEVYDALQIYPNTYVYRQHFPGGFDYARQEILNRISFQATYIGWSNSGDILQVPPRKVREYLCNDAASAVSVNISYLETTEPNPKWSMYPSLRFWKANQPRKWSGTVNETPVLISPQTETISNYPNLMFEYQGVEKLHDAAEILIEQTLLEINNGDFSKVGELIEIYLSSQRLDEAQDICVEVLSRADLNNQTRLGIVEVIDAAYSSVGDRWKAFRGILEGVKINANDVFQNPIYYEYLAICLYYLNDHEQAKLFHQGAKSLDPKNEFQFITNNDQYFS